MDNKDDDFKMEWPEEFAEYADLPPLTDEELNGIITAITPVMRGIRIKRRVRAGVKAGTTMLGAGICVLTAVTLMNYNKRGDIAATEIVQQIAAIPEQEKGKQLILKTHILSARRVRKIIPGRLTVTDALKPSGHIKEPGGYQVPDGGNEQVSEGRVHNNFSVQPTTRIGSAEEVTGSKKQEWLEGAEAPHKQFSNQIIAQDASGKAGNTLPK